MAVRRWLGLIVFCVFTSGHMRAEASVGGVGTAFKPTSSFLVNLVSSFKPRALALGMLITTCFGITACDQGRSIVDVVGYANYFDEVGELNEEDELVGQFVTFYVDDVLYEGYWEVRENGLLLVEVDDGDGKIVLTQYREGEVIPDHQDIGAEVVMSGFIDEFDVWYYGEIIEAYDNGFRLISIDSVEYVHRGQTIDLLPYNVLAHEGVLLKDGGFEFVE